MLDKYKDGQPIAYRIFKNALSSDKVSHAYLIEKNGYSAGIDLAISFAKSLLCMYKHTNLKNCNSCTQCKKIDDNNFTEMKIVNPDGLWIKKEQLLELQSEFSKKAMIGNKKVYIINGAEYLNSSSANSILKFIEEPEDNVIAILVTENINKVISTIVSRCQIVKLHPLKTETNESKSTLYKIAFNLENNEKACLEFINDAKNVQKIENILKFITYYEKNGKDTILFTRSLWFDMFNDKEKNIWGYQLIILFYKDVLKYLCDGKIEIFDAYVEEVKKIADSNSIHQICMKLDKIIKAKDKIFYNINLNLIIDKLIIDLEEVK